MDNFNFKDLGVKNRIISEIQELATELEKEPSYQDMEQHGHSSMHKVQKTFGSWSAAKSAAGFDTEREPRKLQLRTDIKGHEVIRTLQVDYESANDVIEVYHHRLMAVAWYGLDAIKGKVVHHKSGVGWDNREDNIEVLTSEEHGRIHGIEAIE